MHGEIERSIHAPANNKGQTHKRAASKFGVDTVVETTPISLRTIMGLELVNHPRIPILRLVKE
jgi:hypothetical protein